MMKKSPLLILMCLLLVLSCGRAETPAPREPVQPAPSPSSDLAPAAPGQYSLSLNPAPEGPRGKPNAEGEVRRHIAVGHNVLLEMPEGEFVKGWQAVNEFCQSIRCEIIDSSIRQKTPNSPPSGSMRLRVAPEDVKPLFAHLGKVGKVLQHQTSVVNLTLLYIWRFWSGCAQRGRSIQRPEDFDCDYPDRP